jgi:hypothetical protein
MPILRYTSVSRTAARALEEFSDAFKGALALAPPEMWASEIALVVVTDALKTTFPIPLDSAGYHEFKGDMKYRALYNRALSMKSKKWQDGVQELAEIVEAPDFIDWQNQPAKMAVEWARLPNTLAAAVLEANPNLDFYRDPDTGTASSRALFADDHPCNVLIGSDTFDNDKTTTVAKIRSGEFYDDVYTHYAGINGPNGKPMGLRASGGLVLCPVGRELLIKQSLESDTLINAVTNAGAPYGTSNVVAAVTEQNRHKGVMRHVVARELTSNDYLYTIGSGNEECHPLIIMQGASPEEFVHDKSSEMYKNHLKIAIAYVGDANVAAALPHKICRWNITG